MRSTRGSLGQGDGRQRQGRVPRHARGHPRHAPRRRRVHHQHLLAARPRRHGQHQPAVPGLQGRRAAAHESDSPAVRQGPHPRELRAPGAGDHADDGAAPPREGELRSDGLPHPDGPLRRARRDRLRRALPRLRRILVDHGQRAGHRRRVDRAMTVLRAALAVILPIVVVLAYPALGQAPIYPGATWTRAPSADQAGWSAEKLREARAYAGTINTAAVMIVAGGLVVDEWGDTATRFNVHSIRKSVLSALYGIHVRDGQIQLSKTLADLGIDDRSSLTPLEKSATVGDLLKARSGVYHPALYETPGMAAARPARGSYAPEV